MSLPQTNAVPNILTFRMALFSSSEKLRIEQKLALNMAKRKLGAKECPKVYPRTYFFFPAEVSTFTAVL